MAHVQQSDVADIKGTKNRISLEFRFYFCYNRFFLSETILNGYLTTKNDDELRYMCVMMMILQVTISKTCKPHFKSGGCFWFYVLGFFLSFQKHGLHSRHLLSPWEYHNRVVNGISMPVNIQLVGHFDGVFQPANINCYTLDSTT